MLINFEKKNIFIHIPKTGGLTITHTLRTWKRVSNFTRHSSIDDIKERINTDGFKFFTFVRDPYKRFASMYNFLLLEGKVVDTPLTFAINIFTGKYDWNFTHPMCYFCKKVDLHDFGRVENFNDDFERIFGESSKGIVPINKTKRPDHYKQFTQLRDMVARLYFEDFIEFGYPIENFIYRKVDVKWTVEDIDSADEDYIQPEYSLTGSVFDKIPLAKRIAR